VQYRKPGETAPILAIVFLHVTRWKWVQPLFAKRITRFEDACRFTYRQNSKCYEIRPKKAQRAAKLWRRKRHGSNRPNHIEQGAESG
jgi:hypothetical protein